jgi:hypothetical protein
MGDFIGAIGRSVGGLVGGSVHAISVAFDSVVGQLQASLPGPLFPIVMIGSAIALVWVFRKAVL